ncbi:hypothetical protein DIJ64_03285 [Mycobacterium leprae]|uniref:Uncharacterized protein n=1 Tax=Mycobacterium leprae TaxID=1769 RepID=A0AAD0P7E6_MYCLR|nr:hypothetical protein DIJ64_03285 [Mycobacterium leprae]
MVSTGSCFARPYRLRAEEMSGQVSGFRAGHRTFGSQTALETNTVMVGQPVWFAASSTRLASYDLI